MSDGRLQVLRRRVEQGDPQAKAQLVLEEVRTGQGKPLLPVRYCALCKGLGWRLVPMDRMAYLLETFGAEVVAGMEVGVDDPCVYRCACREGGETRVLRIAGGGIRGIMTAAASLALDRVGLGGGVPAGHHHYWYGTRQ